MKTLLLIDANSIIHRMFHALPPLTAPDGTPTNALYGLARVLLKILREQRPEYCAAAFDRKEKTFRVELSADYKATRKPTADALVPQLERSADVFKNFGIRTIDLSGYEADDIIGTLAEKFRGEKDLKIEILTGDLDALQLVDNGKVIVFAIRKGVDDLVPYDETAVKERFGLTPDQLRDYKGLKGDTSDNIKGVPGIGEKTAKELLKEFGSIENIYNDLAIIPDKAAKKLRGQEGKALLSKKLGTIVRDAPIPAVSLSDLEIKKPTTGALKRFFEQYGFRSLVETLERKQ